ncbi:MAG TPA: redoxin domain-containing protein [Gemmataceae bacterium]|nr:redoxin domain-containing protein [Gemmataceae bacterium]
MRWLALCPTILALCAFVPAGSPVREKIAATELLGKTIDNVPLRSTAGKVVPLRDLRGKKATVVVFLSFECPVSKSSCQPLAQLSGKYPEVAFIGLTTSDEETLGQIALYAEEFKLPFPILKDERRAAAQAFQARTTPEAFVLDADMVLRYRGRIDNAYAARLRKNTQVTRHDLQQALDEILAGKSVSTPATQAVGCAIQYETAKKSAGNGVTFYRDVAPILQKHCQTCHRPGEVGPFSLMSYRQAVSWAADLKEYAQNRKMPPWKPVDGHPFYNERKLTDRDIATLAAWVDGGTPEGDPKEAPPPRQFTSGWQLGEPDLVLTMSEEMQIGPTGDDQFRCFVFPTKLAENKFVTALEVRPGNPRIVHHTLLAIDASGQGRKLEQQEREKKHAGEVLDRGPGYPVAMGFGFVPLGGMGGWAPGQMPRYLPEGSGYYLPKGADVVMQVHYHRDGRLEKDRSTIGLYFAKKPVSRRYQSMILPGLVTVIPAGEAHHRVKGSIWIDQDCTLYTVMPHMHMLGKEIKVTMTPPAGKPETLVAIRDWDYNWQETYIFKEPLAVKSGTRFDVEAFYDNSSSNPNNPSNPPRRVTYGQQTTDEMCFVFLGATSDKPGRLRMRLLPPHNNGKSAE